MKKQIANRLGVAHVRDTMEQFISGKITREQAKESLQIGKSQLYELRTSYLAAKASGKSDEWSPGSSGGNHMEPWSDEVNGFLRSAFAPNGDAKRYSYAFAASEVGRRFGKIIDRAQARHWALEHHLGITDYRARPPAHARRWQRQSVGELWQLDATPDYFLGRSNPSLNLLDMLDDCSRMQVGCKLYRHENVPAYIDLFYSAFTRYGLPLEIYVDKASFFRNDDGSLTQLAKRLKFFDISFICANTPEAKGKIERIHQVWQDRLPSFTAREGLDSLSCLEDVNEHLASLVDYRNSFEMHREIGMRPLDAWERAIKEGRCKLRPTPSDAWWELIWSEWTKGMIGPRGRMMVGDVLCTTGCANGTRTWVCHHVDGTVSLVLNKPEKGTEPMVVFTTNPRVNRHVAPR